MAFNGFRVGTARHAPWLYPVSAVIGLPGPVLVIEFDAFVQRSVTNEALLSRGEFGEVLVTKGVSDEALLSKVED